MQPDHEQSLDQIVPNRAPMITEDEPETGKGRLDTSFTAGKILTPLSAFSGQSRHKRPA
jgi:hypothetical protein